MCTVTIITLKDRASATGRRIRLACNRDEQRTRPAGLPPVVRVFGDLLGLMPVDPVSDGTWVAVNTAGLAVTLLNVNPRPSTPRPLRAGQQPMSRGVLIPGILHCPNVLSALTDMRHMSPIEFPPFRLVLLDHRSVGEVHSDGATLNCEITDLGSGPRMFTSSGLGDDVVEPPRRQLFKEMFTATADPAATQDAFHRHHWSDRPHLSICMARPDARTVSHTLIEISESGVDLEYRAGPPDGPAAVHRLSRPRKGAAA